MVCSRLPTERLLGFLPPDILPHAALLGFLTLLRHKGDLFSLSVGLGKTAHWGVDGQLLTTQKRSFINTGYAAWNREAAQTAAKTKRIISNGSHSAGDCNRG